MRLRWTSEAAEELAEISEYLHQQRPNLALSTMKTLYQGAQSLKQMPWRGRSGSKPETRELLFDPLPYILIYRVREDFVQILGFRHTSQQPESS